MAITWHNGATEYTLPYHDSDGVVGPAMQFHGSAGRTLGAKLRVDSIAPHTARISMRWSAATAAERTTIETAYDACAHLESTLTLNDGDSYVTLAYHNGLNIVPYYTWNDTPVYQIEIVFDEVV